MKRQGEAPAGVSNKKLWKKTAKLPDAPGVYFFMGKKKGTKRGGHNILYVGKATSLRDRVRSYFRDDVIHTRGSRIVDMVSQAIKIDFVEADSVLEALILEANLIKKYQPHYNTDEKDDKSFNYVIITKEDFPVVQVIRGKDLEEHFPKNKLKYVFGPYPQGGTLREGMRIVRKIFPWRDQRCTPCGQEINGVIKNPTCAPCFNRQIGLCPGVCTGEISKQEYGKIISSIALFFEGKKSRLLKKLEREMMAAAKKREFECAAEVRKTLFALTHIQDVSLIKEEEKEEQVEQALASGDSSQIVAARGIVPVATVPKSLIRIEGYDIAHLGGKNMVGVMVVLEDHHIKKSDYRMFKVRSQKDANDTGALKEVLHRRLNHPEWPFPNIIVADGGIAQKNAVEEVLRERGFDIAVVSVVKNDKHRPENTLGDSALISRFKKEILLINSEAHRFAIKFHRKLRSKLF